MLSPVHTRGTGGGLEPVALGPAARAGEPEGRRALDAAVRAWGDGRGDWPRASLQERIRCVLDFVKRAEPLREPVARALLWEVGKPWADSLKEFDRTLDYIRETVEALLDVERSAARGVRAGGFEARVRRAPLGVALCLGPYNYAVNEVFTLVIPALIMGNPVVVKTPRYGVRANALLASALAGAFPAGSVGLVTGDGPALVGPMMESGSVDVLALIGSHRTAQVLLRQHPHPYRLRSVLGMGAKNPAIVLEDADLDAAAPEIVSGALTFNGQRCTAIKLVLAQRRVADALVERLAAEVESLKVGMPWEGGVAITPLPDPERPAYLEGLVEDALAGGARVVNRGGGERAATLFRPALVYPVASGAKLHSVEQFGPILPVATFDEPEEALGVLERSPFGQQASVFGRDPAVVGPLVDHLANLVCRVNLNAQCRRGPDVLPFTGRKDSAAGTLSVTDALRVFSIRSLVAERDGEGMLEALAGTSTFLEQPGPEGG
jgi:aldehyde dehydrogenase (NAD+)